MSVGVWGVVVMVVVVVAVVEGGGGGGRGAGGVLRVQRFRAHRFFFPVWEICAISAAWGQGNQGTSSEHLCFPTLF